MATNLSRLVLADPSPSPRSAWPWRRRTSACRLSWGAWRRTSCTPGTTRYVAWWGSWRGAIDVNERNISSWAQRMKLVDCCLYFRPRRRWTRSTRRTWSRAGTSTRPCGRWGRATPRGGSTSSRTCKAPSWPGDNRKVLVMTIEISQVTPFRPPLLREPCPRVNGETGWVMERTWASRMRLFVHIWTVWTSV